VRPFFRLPLHLCALTLWLAAAAQALPSFTASPQGDWFDGANWSGGAAPSATDDPVIDNGAFANVSSRSPLYPGGGAAVEVNDLLVGSRLDASAPTDASGTLEAEDVDLFVAGDLHIGADLDSSEVARAVGFVTSYRRTQAARDVIVRGQALIGVAGFTGSAARGGLTVAGDFETGDRLGIGVTSAGVAHGSAAVGGDLRVVASEDQLGNGFAEVLVGSTYNTIPETPEPATMGSLWVVGDMSAIFDGEFRTTSLDVGFAHGATRQASGFAKIDGDLLGFTDVAVGFAEADDPFATGADAFAQGELHVAGELADSPLPSGYPRSLSVGVTTAFPINSFNAGSARAEGIATIGEIEGRNVAVGIAGSGPATGRLEIGGGDMLAAIVGQTTSDSDAEGTLTTGGGIQISALVGVSEGGGAFQFSCQCVTPFVTGDAVGSLVADGFVYSASVGLLRSDGSAIGSLEVEGVHPSFQSSPGSVLVGYSDRGGAAGTAEGRMSVRSGVEATRIAVGALEGSMFPASNPPRPSGTAVGVLETTGDVTSRGGVGLQSPGDAVGYGNAFSHGDADGTWILHDGTYTGRRLIVGGSDGTGSGRGLIHLDQMFVDLDDLTLGDGATVELEIAGALRGTEYSAIDADRASLDGDLAIAFTEPAQVGVYDLIVSAALDGIFGDFDSVSVAGLAAGQSAFWGIETTGGTSPVEVYRLHVVPEPTTGALVALGLLGLAMRARRARAGR
jgi:PEP-CTERM motif